MKNLSMTMILIFSLFSISVKSQTVDNENNVLNIMSYNIAGFMLYEKEIGIISNLIKKYDVDLVGMQEVDSMHPRLGLYPQNHYVVGIMKAKTGLNGYYMGAHYNNTYGLGVLSKKSAIGNKKIITPNNGVDPESQIIQIVEFKNYFLFNTHFTAATNGQWNRLESAKLLNRLAKQYSYKPIFLVGDLNAEPHEEPIHTLQNEWTLINYTEVNTFPATLPRKTIDYVFAYDNKDANGTPRNYNNRIKTEVIPETEASDHRPVLVKIFYSKTIPTFIKNNTTWSTQVNQVGDLVIQSNTLTLTATSNLIMGINNSIIIESGAKLIIDGGKVTNANIIAKAGSILEVKNNGKILLGKEDNLSIESGANYEMKTSDISFL